MIVSDIRILCKKSGATKINIVILVSDQKDSVKNHDNVR